MRTFPCFVCFSLAFACLDFFFFLLSLEAFVREVVLDSSARQPISATPPHTAV